MTASTFEALGLAQPLLRALSDQNYTEPTAIQAKAIPHLLAGRDVLALAQTGTGKTAAFGLPLLQMLSARKERPKPRTAQSLILVPTRELAVQILASMKVYARYLNLSFAAVMGGVAFGPQVKAVGRGVDCLVATPGRLLDLIGDGAIDLSKTAFIVLDEADRMLDMGFIGDVRKIVKSMPASRQAMLLSATMPPDIAKLSKELLRDPLRLEVEAQTVAVDRIEQRLLHISAAKKFAMLSSLLGQPEYGKVIVFARTKRTANRLAEKLADDGTSAEAIHGNKTQSARQRALENFRNGQTRVLVATDIVSRGIDVDGISHVINYELPEDAEAYVHRIGRTARAGAEGIAISFCDGGERSRLRDIERLLGHSIAVMDGGSPIDSPNEVADTSTAKPRSRRSRRPRPTTASGTPAGRPQAQRSKSRFSARPAYQGPSQG